MSVEGINQILSSLDVIYSSVSTNTDRHSAQDFLESIKKLPESPFWGYQLALPDNNYNYIVRHFALNLLLHSITNHYSDWDMSKKLAVRNWIVELSTKISNNDPHYIKEKIAFLWVEIAKRCWGQCLSIDREDENSKLSLTNEQKLESWSSMDSNLLELWNHSPITRELSLIILRTLFEDIYLLDDPIVSQRSNILYSLCPEIVVSESILSLQFESDDSVRSFAASNDGWLIRCCQLLDECLNNLIFNPITDESLKQSSTNFLIKLLQVFKTNLYWIIPVALRDVGILSKLSNLLKINDIKIQTLTIDCFQILFTRNYNNEEDFEDIVGSIFQTEGLSMFFKFFQTIQLDPDDIDENKYTLLKKLVEMLVGLSDYILSTETTSTNANSTVTTTNSSVSSSKFKLTGNTDYLNYYKLILETTKHESLVISGLSLQFWCSMLRCDALSDKPDFESIMPELLENCSNRLLNYGDSTKDSIPMKYLEIDFENQSDQNSFLTNFRRLNDDIVRIIVCKKPKDALLWLADRLNKFYSSAMGIESLNNPKLTYKGENSETYAYSYAQFVIIEACVRGVSRWMIWYNKDDLKTNKAYLIEQIDSLCKMLLMLNINDPILLRKQIQTFVQFTPLLKDVNSTMFKVLEKVIQSCTYPYPEDANDELLENIRDLRASGGTELNRLAYLMPESLKNILPELENVINTILSENKLTSHESVAFKSFLLVVSQRSSIDNKEERFSRIVDPELMAWSNPDTEKGLLDLHWFMERLGIVKIAEYFQSRGITANTNLLEAQMDERGRALKKELKDHWSSIFPIRATRIFIQYSIEKLDHDSETYQNLLKLWKPRITPILPHILQLIYQTQAYHNPKNWEGLPVEVRSFVKYSCMERFWQQGISIQSKESFVDESVKAMHTLRDFADSVGHIVRYTREYAYLMISSITELEETLYEIPNSASLIWKALTGESVGITLHSWRHMMNLVVRNVIKNCPIEYINIFMPEFLPQMLSKVDETLVGRWDVVYRKGLQLEGNESDEQLSEEMLEEHMLRQLTAVVDRMLIDLVGQQSKSNLTEKQLKVRELICQDFKILAPFLNLVFHIITFKDTRCTFNAILLLKYMISDLIALNDNEVDDYLNENLIPILIIILTDKFYADAHSEAAYTLTILYLGQRYKSSYPSILLKNALEISDEEINQFENMLANCKKLRERKNCLISLINSSKKSENGEEIYSIQRTKMLETISRNRKKNETDGLEGGLNGLFGDNIDV